MVIITLQRKKCIGCNYCAELSPDYFRMSRKDGKSTLLKSHKKKEFYIVKTNLPNSYELNQKAKKACPVKVIQIKTI